jgi:hypothetical protein
MSIKRKKNFEIWKNCSQKCFFSTVSNFFLARREKIADLVIKSQ